MGRRLLWTRGIVSMAGCIAVMSGCVCAVAQAPQAAPPASSTAAPAASPAAINANAKQLARLLGLDTILDTVSGMRSARACGSTATLDELTAREELVESIQAASLDTDSVLAQLGNEQSELTELRAELESRRDKSVARLNTAALLTGSGLGAVVSATQFTTLGSRTQNTGDALGVGAGITSTILSLLAAKRQNGPSGTIRHTAHMLGALLDAQPAAPEAAPEAYPPAVLGYLNSVPDNEGAGASTRLDQLRAEWLSAGRLPAAPAKGATPFAAFTSSDNPSAPVSIADLTNRIAMLGDVRGRVALMKHDLATLRRMSVGAAACAR